MKHAEIIEKYVNKILSNNFILLWIEGLRWEVLRTECLEKSKITSRQVKYDSVFHELAQALFRLYNVDCLVQGSPIIYLMCKLWIRTKLIGEVATSFSFKQKIEEIQKCTSFHFWSSTDSDILTIFYLENLPKIVPWQSNNESVVNLLANECWAASNFVCSFFFDKTLK